MAIDVRLDSRDHGEPSPGAEHLQSRTSVVRPDRLRSHEHIRIVLQRESPSEAILCLQDVDSVGLENIDQLTLRPCDRAALNHALDDFLLQETFIYHCPTRVSPQSNHRVPEFH